MPTLSKQEADAHDRVLDAAMRLADLLVSQGINMEEYALEELTLFLARNSRELQRILQKCARKL